MQRDIPGQAGDRTPSRRCPRCEGSLRTSHREYAGGGSSATVVRCAACGYSQRGALRSDADRVERNRRGSRHPGIDEGPPSNPVIDADLARRLLDDLGG